MYLFIFSFGPSSVFYAIIISTVGSVFSRSLLPPSPLGLISYSTMRRESRLWWRSRGIFVTIRVHASATNGSSEQKVSQESITTTTPPPPSSSTTATTADATIFTKSQRDKRNKKKKKQKNLLHRLRVPSLCCNILSFSVFFRFDGCKSNFVILSILETTTKTNKYLK